MNEEPYQDVDLPNDSEIADGTVSDSNAANHLPMYAETLSALSLPTVTAPRTPDPPEPKESSDRESPTTEHCLDSDLPNSAIDPGTIEGAAILRLFRIVKFAEQAAAPTEASAGLSERLSTWFRSVGIEPLEHPMDVARRLTLAARSRPGRSLRASDYTFRIGTENLDASALLKSATRSLSGQLGPGTVVILFDADDEPIAQSECASHAPPADV